MGLKRNTAFVAGLLLVLCSFAVLLGSGIHDYVVQQRAEKLVERMEALLPERTEGTMHTHADGVMPVLQLDGVDFSGLLHFPDLQRTLPIQGSWEKEAVFSNPCRFWGSVYNGNLVIGGGDQLGQFDFFHQLQPGSQVVVTDMTGTEFSFRVRQIDRATQAGADFLIREDTALTLFVRQRYSLEYLVVRCDWNH